VGNLHAPSYLSIAALSMHNPAVQLPFWTKPDKVAIPVLTEGWGNLVWGKRLKAVLLRDVRAGGTAHSGLTPQ
jgi:hypothetical protein